GAFGIAELGSFQFLVVEAEQVQQFFYLHGRKTALVQLAAYGVQFIVIERAAGHGTFKHLEGGGVHDAAAVIPVHAVLRGIGIAVAIIVPVVVVIVTTVVVISA